MEEECKLHITCSVVSLQYFMSNDVAFAFIFIFDLSRLCGS